jgi:hypothetical protein
MKTPYTSSVTGSVMVAGIAAVISAMVILLGLYSGSEVGEHPGRMVGLAMVGVTVLFVIKRPILGLALAGASDVTIYYISGLTRLPPRVYLAVLVTGLSVPQIIRTLKHRRWVRRIVGVGLALSMLIVMVDAAYGHTDVLRRTFSRRIAPLMLLLCICSHIRTERDFKLMVRAVVGATLFSCIIAIFQYQGWDMAWDLRLNLEKYTKYGAVPVENAWDDPRIGRIMGMAGNPIHFSYHLVLAMSFLVPMAFLRIGRRSTRIMVNIGLAIVIIATIQSLTRSAILALWLVILVVGMPILGGRLRQRGKTMAAVFTMILVVATILLAVRTLSENVQSKRIYSFVDINRATLIRGTLRVIAKHPLGVGSSRTQKTITDNFHEFEDLPNAEVLKDQVAHNYLLNTAAFWGIPGLFLTLWFFALILRCGQDLRRSIHEVPPYARWVPTAITAFIVGYLCQSSLHNAGPFYAEIASWYYMAILISAHNLRRSVPQGGAALPEPRIP